MKDQCTTLIMDVFKKRMIGPVLKVLSDTYLFQPLGRFAKQLVKRLSLIGTQIRSMDKGKELDPYIYTTQGIHCWPVACKVAD